MQEVGILRRGIVKGFVQYIQLFELDEEKRELGELGYFDVPYR